MSPSSDVLFLLALFVLSAAVVSDSQLVPLEDLMAESRERIQGSRFLCVGANNCCSDEKPCALGEGDCDPNRNQCMRGLICGTDECQAYNHLLKERYPNPLDVNFSGTDDCCVLPKGRRGEWLDWLRTKADEAETIPFSRLKMKRD